MGPTTSVLLLPCVPNSLGVAEQPGHAYSTAEEDGFPWACSWLDSTWSRVVVPWQAVGTGKKIWLCFSPRGLLALS